MFEKIKLITKAIKVLKMSHHLYARAERENDTELLNFIDEVFELAENALKEMH